MKKLVEFSGDDKFYRGTIIVIKEAEITPKGNFDKRYCLINIVGGSNFQMLDLYRSIGGCIIKDLKPNVEGHFAVNKQAIRNWVDEYFRLFYTHEGYIEWSSKIDDIVYIENLSNYFTQANRDLFLS